MSRRYETIEMIRRKISMSQKIVVKDSDYGLYAGSELTDSYRMALIDVLCNNEVFPEPFQLFIKLYREYLNQRRKAFFASTCSELSKLGFILGLRDESIRVGKST